MYGRKQAGEILGEGGAIHCSYAPSDGFDFASGPQQMAAGT